MSESNNPKPNKNAKRRVKHRLNMRVSSNLEARLGQFVEEGSTSKVRGPPRSRTEIMCDLARHHVALATLHWEEVDRLVKDMGKQ